MERRGVDRNKISILPNGVNSTLFKPLDRDMELAKELGLMDKTVIGYVGSMVMYEGLELLVEAFSLCPKISGINHPYFLLEMALLWNR